MADQENRETTPDAEPPAAEEAPAPEAAEEQAAPEARAAEAEADVASEEVAPAAPAAAPSEPQAPQLTPQERRVAARAKRGRRRASTPDERLEMRKAKASARSRRRQQERAKKTTKGEGTPPAEHGTGTPAVRMGKVVSDKADKTITVRIDIAKRHRRYRKIVRSSSTLHAHDERNDANEGDLVRVVECRPMSRTKRWRLVEILERAK
jgi:small subunit ribosomal protein S17